MTDYFRFQSLAGPGVVVDMDTLEVCWEGTTPGSMVFVLTGSVDPVEVVADFDKFVTDWLTHYDCRPPKEKPRRKTRQGSSPELTVVSSTSSAREDTQKR